MNNIALDKTYSIEGHLSIRLVLDEDGKWYYGFLDDGLNAEKAIAKGEKLACTHLYRIGEEQKIDLEDYLSKEKKADGKSLLDLICGKDKYVIQRKEFDDNTSLVALSFIGVEISSHTPSLNRILIDNGDKENGVRESLPNSIDTENNLNNTIIKSRSSDDIKLDLDGLEILKIVGPETYNYKYNVAVQVEDKNGPYWFIMDGEGKKYNTKFSDIKVAESGFSFTMDVLPGAYISGIIDEKEPVGFKEVLLTTEGFVRFNGCFPIQCIKGCGGIKYNDKEGPFVIDTLVDKKAIEYCGVLSPKGQIDDKLIVRTIKSCDVVTDSWELQLDAARAKEMVENERKELSKIDPFLGKGGKNNIAISNIDETILDSSGEALEEIKGQEGYRFFKDGQIIGIKDRQGNNRPYVFDANSNEIIKLKNIGDLESGTRYRRSVNSDVAELLMKMNFLKKEKSFIVDNHKVTFLLDLNDRSECVGAVLNTRYSVDFSKPGVEQHAYPDLLGPSVCFVPIVKVVGFNPKEIPIGFEAVENGIGISLNAQVDNDFNLKGKCTATATSCKRVASSKHPKITDKMLKEWAKIIVSNLEEVINLDILDPDSKEMAKKGNKGFKSKLLNVFRRIKR